MSFDIIAKLVPPDVIEPVYTQKRQVLETLFKMFSTIKAAEWERVFHHNKPKVLRILPPMGVCGVLSGDIEVYVRLWRMYPNIYRAEAQLEAQRQTAIDRASSLTHAMIDAKWKATVVLYPSEPLADDTPRWFIDMLKTQPLNYKTKPFWAT